MTTIYIQGQDGRKLRVKEITYQVRNGKPGLDKVVGMGVKVEGSNGTIDLSF